MKKRGWENIPKDAAINEAIEKAREYLRDNYDIPYNYIPVYMNKSARNFGCCWHTRPRWYEMHGDITITFNSAIVNSEHDYYKEIAPLVAHEFAHAVENWTRGHAGHGCTFRRYAYEIAKAIGGDPQQAMKTYETRNEMKSEIKPAITYGLAAIGNEWKGRKRYARRGDAIRVARSHIVTIAGVRYPLTVCEYMEAGK